MFNENRPKLKLTKTKTQKALDIATFGTLLLASIYAIISYSTLPDQVPMHFNLSGKVDDYGNKNTVWVLIILAFGLCYGLFKLNNYPHLFNYPNPITEDNAESQYKSAIKIMSLVNFMMALLFALIIYQIVSLGISGEKKTTVWSEYLIYAIVSIMIFGPLIWVIKTTVSSSKKG
ncbi:DUF1648 domain-containing protein [uncultured Lacinutrix sp.]|uniref:DUF1648 domain-containing protein n=1 Tax=uncultured Lacinutrix sp. TaxID=574032 RepID=UPI002623FEBF|nr:DUF1648 domain-containing protein [uncultured Lacinutrix sp.]